MIKKAIRTGMMLLICIGILIFAMNVIMVKAAADIPYSLSVGEIDIIDNSKLTGNMPVGVNYDSSTNTLTLNNYNGSTTNEINRFINCNGDLNIRLVGTNLFSGDARYGIEVYGNLNIMGEGLLTLDMSRGKNVLGGIKAQKKLYIESTTVNIIGSNVGNEGYFYGISLSPWSNYYEGINDACVKLENATVSISNVVNAVNPEILNIGIDSQDADLQFINSKVNIQLTRGYTWGFLTGLYKEDEEKCYGGKLSIDDKSWITFEGIESRGSEEATYATYFYIDNINAKYLYTGSSAPGALTSKMNALSSHDWIDERTECMNTYLEVSPHKWDDGIVIKNATSTNTGEKKYVCTECGETKIVTIPKLKNSTTNSQQTTTKAPIKTIKTTKKISKPAKVQGLSLKIKKPKKVRLTWKKVSGANGYKIQYAGNKKLKSATTKFTSKTTYITKKLKKKKTYYFRVRAYKLNGRKKVYGSWSKVKKIKVK